MDNPNTTITGRTAERLASEYLKEKGLRLLECNYRTKAGEIDLIMQDDEEIVFVEVRLRNNPHFGNAIDTIDQRKQQKIIITATHYLSQKNLIDKVNCRFDVIGISYPQTKAVIEWIQDAFPADDF
jgi:putative endonuclease